MFEDEAAQDWHVEEERKEAEVEPCEIFREVEREDDKNLLTRAILEKEGEVQGKTGL